MAQIPVLGSGPIDISVGGKQYSFPLSAFYFDDSGTLQINTLFLTNTPFTWGTSDPLRIWVTYLAQQKLLTQGQTPTPQPAFSIQARDPGSTGNFITIRFDNVNVPNGQPIENTTADVTVTETDTYEGLTLDTLASIIGTTTGGGSRPGLVFLASAIVKGTTTLPAAPVTATKSAGKPYTFDFGTNTFTLQAKHDDDNGQFSSVAITKIDGNTFTMVATWNKTANVSLKDLRDAKTPFAYELTVKPAGGAFTAAPAKGTITLSGGVDAQPAANAQAIVPSAP